MSHIIIIIDGDPVAVEHEKGEGGGEGGRVASGVSVTTGDAVFAHDHLPTMIQIAESDEGKMEKILKFCEKLCKKDG